MIKKLDAVKDVDNFYYRDDLAAAVPAMVAVINKINEIIDVINTSQSLQVKKAEPVDKFAEQKRWIGKLCKFWSCATEEPIYDILTEIDVTIRHPYLTKDGFGYSYCEPVSEDLIYKGE